jgi:hypothetical protein
MSGLTPENFCRDERTDPRDAGDKAAGGVNFMIFHRLMLAGIKKNA